MSMTYDKETHSLFVSTGGALYRYSLNTFQRTDTLAVSGIRDMLVYQDYLLLNQQATFMNGYQGPSQIKILSKETFELRKKILGEFGKMKLR